MKLDMGTSRSNPLKTRAEALRHMSPHLVADVYLYPTDEGGRNLSVQPGWGCPCSCSKSIDAIFYDGWPVLDAPFAPGERRRLGFVFLEGKDFSSEDIATILRRRGTFYRSAVTVGTRLGISSLALKKPYSTHSPVAKRVIAS